jgi:methylthioribose-1-phosphate isomerase
MKRAVASATTPENIKKTLIEEAVKIHAEEAEATAKISRSGADLVEDGWTILTHCNTGPLATSGYGTALGIIIMANQQGKNIEVYVDETRPLLQGARLTTWELKKAGVKSTLITDSMAGYFINSGRINGIITGADRIAANGDSANKIGTYVLAVLAHENKIPFYIAAPTTTIDPKIKTGDEIPIEERKPEEVTRIQGVALAPDGVNAANPAFDVTPHRYITAIITEKGIVRLPYTRSIKSLL